MPIKTTKPIPQTLWWSLLALAAVMSELAVFDHLPDSVFTSPEPVAAE